MSILNLIEFYNPPGAELIVYKLPENDSTAIANGSQLVVQENQVAFVYRDGQALDEFGPGRHTLTTKNIPLLAALQGLPYGNRTPFRCYVVYVMTKVFTNLGWGTASPILFRDSEFRMVTLRAHGQYSILISEPRTFINTIVGARGLAYTYPIQDYFRSHIVSALNEILANNLTTILDLPAKYSAINQQLSARVRGDFAQFGIELVDLVIEAITVPPEVQEMLNRATGVAAQDADKFRQVITTEAMLQAARNPGGAGEGMGAGVGIGLGLGAGMAAAKDLASAASGAAASAAQPSLTKDELKAKLTALKELLDGGLINEDDYNKRKGELLSQL